MVYPKQPSNGNNSNNNNGGGAGGDGIGGKKGGRSIFDRPELRGSVNRRSASPAEERIIRVDSRKKIASSATRLRSSSTVKDRLRKISDETLVRKQRPSSSPQRDGGASRGKPRINVEKFVWSQFNI